MIEEIRKFTHKIRRKKLFFILPFLVIICLTLIYVFNKQSLYQLKARIKIEDAFGVEPLDDKILFKALSNLNLLDINNSSAPISSLRQRMAVNKDNRNNLIDILIVGNNPVELAKLVNEITKVYVEEVNFRANETKKQGIHKKRLMLEGHKKTLKKNLLEAEERLTSYKKEIDKFKIEDEKRKATLSSLGAQLLQLERERDNLMRIYTSVHPDVVRVDSEITDLKEKINSVPQESPTKLALEKKIKDSRQLYIALKEKWNEVSLDLEAEESSTSEIGATVVSYAQETPPPPDPMKIILIGALIAIATGSLATSVATVLDTSMLTQEELASYTHLPVVGTIPYIKPLLSKKGRTKEKSNLILRYEDDAGVIEPYRLLFAHIQSAIFNGQLDGKSIFLTSSMPREGKSVTASNLALVMARGGKQVLLIDGNFIRPSIHELFGIKSRKPGLTDVLHKDAVLDEVVKDVTDILLGGFDPGKTLKFKGVDRLKFITAGSHISDASGLLNSEDMNAIMSELRSRFDCIIIDGPSISSSADTVILASKCEATLIVYLAGKTPRSYFKAVLSRAGAMQKKGLGITNIKGVILNKCI